MKTFTAAEANRQFSAVLREVASGQRVMVTSRGKPVATIEPVRRTRGARASVAKRRLLQRLDADGSDNNGNLPWALNVLVEALTALGRFAEARMLLPRSLAVGRRFGTSVAWQGVLALLVAEQRHAAAGRLLGHLSCSTALRATRDA